MPASESWADDSSGAGSETDALPSLAAQRARRRRLRSTCRARSADARLRASLERRLRGAVPPAVTASERMAALRARVRARECP